MMKRIVGCLAAAWFAATAVQAQEVVIGADFDTRFDNREYAGSSVEQSKTLFTARLIPQAGVQWDERNALMIGADLRQHCGDPHSLSAIKPLVSYAYRAPKVTAMAGIFLRNNLKGDYTEAFFDSDKLFYDNRVQGFLGQYHPDAENFVEFSLDWHGMKDWGSREKFRILSAGHRQWAHWYGGYAFSMLHFAGSEEIVGNVVDYMTVNPHVGVRFGGGFAFDLRLGYLQGFQRDRRTDEGWKLPKGGLFDIAVRRWGLSLENMLYVGEDQLPFYDLYGEELYSASRFFSTPNHFYNRTTLAYEGRFYHDSVRVKAGLLFHCDGEIVGLQQIVELSVRLQKICSKHAK